MKNKTIIIIIINALLLLALTACENSSDESQMLEGKTWFLEFIGDTPVLEGTSPTATFEDGKMSGNASCNHYNGAFEIDGDRFNVSETMSTLMYCMEEGINDQETRFLGFLAEVETFSIEGNRLMLTKADGESLLFELEKNEDTFDLEGTKWDMLTIGKASVLEGSEITVEFSDGQIGGNAGCNHYGGEFAISGNSITMGMIANTEMACMQPEGVMEQETRFLAFLSEIVSADLVDGQLILSKADGDSLTFEPWTEPEPVDLNGTIWNLLYIGEEKEDNGAVTFMEYAIIEGTVITAEFKDGKISGSASCNTYNAGVEIVGSKMSIGLAMTTKMFCGEPEGTMEQEAKFLKFLSQVESYIEDQDSSLILNKTDGSRLTFEPYTEVETINLDGTSWNLLTLNGNPVIEGTEVTAHFADGGMGGKSSCNTYNAGYETDGNMLSIGMAISTLMFCEQPEGVMEQEQRYLAFLGEVVSADLVDGQLILSKADGDSLTFEPIVE